LDDNSEARQVQVDLSQFEQFFRPGSLLNHQAHEIMQVAVSGAIRRGDEP
jgi:hypothetical protein